MDRRDLAIGVFDSGVGGLTVLRALMEALPNERTVYLGDTARVPYGTRSHATVTRYALGNARFLIGQRIKLLVVACNTVSAESLPALRAAFDVPVVGVVEPGAQAAFEASKGGAVGVIGTQATVSSGAYTKALRERDPTLRVISRSCPLFVPLAEEGWTEGDVPNLAAERYLAPFRGEGITTLVLGCTHYPLLRTPIARALPGVELVDSATSTAKTVRTLLANHELLREAPSPSHSLFVTDLPTSFTPVAERFLGRTLPPVEQVDVIV